MNNPTVKHTSFELCSPQCVFVGWLQFNNRLPMGAIPFCRRLIVCLAARNIVFVGEKSGSWPPRSFKLPHYYHRKEVWKERLRGCHASDTKIARSLSLIKLACLLYAIVTKDVFYFLFFLGSARSWLIFRCASRVSASRVQYIHTYVGY